ncbi:hypothetical protein QFZ72_003384 [Bacillus sp. V2I10]|nr:hypothetical protein [Bacillus sp. V2I10]MDQ0859905.1 hypothetical protein [Bacillus sp. V2I10]
MLAAIELLEEIHREIAETHVELLHLQFVDLEGNLKHVTITIDQLEDAVDACSNRLPSVKTSGQLRGISISNFIPFSFAFKCTLLTELEIISDKSSHSKCKSSLPSSIFANSNKSFISDVKRVASSLIISK